MQERRYGTESEVATAIAWFGMALEGDRLLSKNRCGGLLRRVWQECGNLIGGVVAPPWH